MYNHFLAEWKETYETTGKGLGYNECSKRLTALKKTLPWLKTPDSTALQNALQQLAEAFDRFFEGTVNAPRFKSKNTRTNRTPPSATTQRTDALRSKWTAIG